LENEDQPIEGITEDTPDEITDFVRSNDVADKYVVMLKQRPEGGGPAQTLRSFSNYYPNVNTLGKEWGPGSYSLIFSWRGEGKSGKKETLTKEFKIDLPERAWADEHDQYLMERSRKRQSDLEKVLKNDAMKNRILGPQIAPVAAPVSEFETMKKMLELAKSLGVPIGGQVKAEPKEKEKKSFAERLIDMAPAITAIGAALSPVAVAYITRKKEPEDKSTTNLLLNHLLTQKPQENDVMKQFVPFLMGTMKQMMDFKESIQPEEKESLVERLIEKLAPMVPQVLALATMPRQQLDNNPMVKMARNMPDVRQMTGDAEMLRMAVPKLDEIYGAQSVDDILAVAGVSRPVEFRDNYQKFPSKGYRSDGTLESEPPKESFSTPDDGRGAKLPDEAMGANTEDLNDQLSG